MAFYFLLVVAFWILVPVLIIGGIVKLIRRKRHGKGDVLTDREWYLRAVLSREDGLSQAFFSLALFSLGVTIAAFNVELGSPLETATVVLITSLAGLAVAYGWKVLYPLALSLVGLVGWWTYQASLWANGAHVKSGAIFAGLSIAALLLYATGRLHEMKPPYKRFALAYRALGVVYVTGVLFYLSTKPGVISIGDMTKGDAIFGSWQLTLSLLTLSIAAIGATLYGGVKNLISRYEVLAVMVLIALFGSMALLPEQVVATINKYGYYSSRSVLSGLGVFWALLFNVAILAELVGLVFLGYARRETRLINLGAALLFLFVTVKYFDWFFTFLDKSVFFIGAGLLLFALGWFLERGRRRMVATVRAQEGYQITQ